MSLTDWEALNVAVSEALPSSGTQRNQTILWEQRRCLGIGFISLLFCPVSTETQEVATSVGNFHRSHNMAMLDKSLFVLLFLPSIITCPDIPSSSYMSRRMIM